MCHWEIPTSSKYLSVSGWQDMKHNPTSSGYWSLGFGFQITFPEPIKMTDELRSLRLSTIILGMFWFTQHYRRKTAGRSRQTQPGCFISKLSVKVHLSFPAWLQPAWVFRGVMEVVVVTSVCQIPQDQSQIDFSPIHLFRSSDEEDYVLHFLTRSQSPLGLGRSSSIGWESVNLPPDWLKMS